MEALESIYVNELEIISTNPYSYTITIPCEIQNIEPGKPPKEFSVGLKFEIPEEYPDIPPEIFITEGGELDEDLQKEIIIELNKKAEEELGCIMVFTLVSELQDRVNDFADAIYNKKLKEKEDEEKIPVFHGTMVTRQNFMEWHANFLREKNVGKVKVVSDKLSGRQIFLAKGGNIEISDQLLGDADDDVEVDESLFDEDLDEMMMSSGEDEEDEEEE